VFRAPRQVLLLAELAAGVALHATDRGWWHCGDIGAGVDYPGNDLGATVVGSARECQERCTAEPQCRSFTWAAAGTCTKDTEDGWYAGAVLHCGTASCTAAVWDAAAGTHSCGERITWLQENADGPQLNEAAACAHAATEFPAECSGCDPTATGTDSPKCP
jgi:hypothetical protein